MEKPCLPPVSGTDRLLTGRRQLPETQGNFLPVFCSNSIWARRSPPLGRGAGFQKLWLSGGSSSTRHGFDTFAEPRNLSGGGILVNHLLLRAPHQLGLGLLEGGAGSRPIALGNRLLDLADGASHAASAGLVDLGSPHRLASGLLCRSRIRHILNFPCGVAGLYPSPPTASTMGEAGGTLADEGGHPLLLIGGGEHRLEQPALETGALGKGAFEGAVHRLLGHHHRRAGETGDPVGDG